MSFWGSDPFAEHVDKATGENLPAGADPDIALSLEIADQIKGKQVPALQAMRAIKAKIQHKNPNVQLRGLKLADICVKNGGHHFLQQVASKEFMDSLEGIINSQVGTNMRQVAVPHPEVRSKILELVQTWAHAFKEKPDLSLVGEVYTRLKYRGFAFPAFDPTAASSALVDTATAPTWTDSNTCDRCRTAFTFTNRKHHCRNCGGTFCQQCSSKELPLPKFGITTPVRVCDGCHGRLTGGAELLGAKPSFLDTKPPLGGGYPGAVGPAVGGVDPLDADIQRAIQLSLAESSSPPLQRKPPTSSAPAKSGKEDDLAHKEQEDLERAIAESLKEVQISSAPRSLTGRSGDGGITVTAQPHNPNALTEVEIENVRLFAELVEKLEEEGAGRNWQGGAVGGEAVEALHHQIALLQPKLVSNLSDSVKKYRLFVSFNAKLEQALRTYDEMLNKRLEAARNAGATIAGGGYGSYPAQGGYPSTSTYPSTGASSSASYAYPSTGGATSGPYQPTNPYPSMPAYPEYPANPSAQPSNPYPSTTNRADNYGHQGYSYPYVNASGTVQGQPTSSYPASSVAQPSSVSPYPGQSSAYPQQYASPAPQSAPPGAIGYAGSPNLGAQGSNVVPAPSSSQRLSGQADPNVVAGYYQQSQPVYDYGKGQPQGQSQPTVQGPPAGYGYGGAPMHVHQSAPPAAAPAPALVEEKPLIEL
ncbi:ubiquitin binding protein [Gonapodya prolifera JEL478]|uniref:Vacuolar protein sorting-associated protein 27 n=1 Tax=Gonapodya prolifera (strain JEL478) TaxID=1344416 RepID=A0A139A5N4_GONPJ|nr:ubiquitin binding protein [Gonapodya prolifera JEL478]|eukprot:KXS12132.1 ubiquitin binding protein [Gonapodya prolifera JEL478]